MSSRGTSTRRLLSTRISGWSQEQSVAGTKPRAVWRRDHVEELPVLVMHGDDDQIVPYSDSGPLSAKLLRNGTLKTYKGFPHGMPTTQAEVINRDLLAFIGS